MLSNQTKYNTLRQTFHEFVYESYKYDVQSDGLHIVFTFRLGKDIVFHPSALIPSRHFLNFDQPTEVLNTLVFNIGLIELVSYWKCACPQRVRIDCGTVDSDQAAFWKKIYWGGLGEFFYTNGISTTIEDFMEVESVKMLPHSLIHNPHPPTPDTRHYLVPIGGGKDSVVTLELLSAHGTQHIRPLIMNPRGATVGCAEAAGYPLDDVLVIHRTIDPRLLELNSEGYLNGHTPFSAMLALYTLLAAELSGIPNIALSNESSANEATVVGTDVNHQYSKSLEFEDDFRQYVAHYISPSLNYFSFLRPLTELQIAMLFSQNEKYFDVFRSCNAGSKQDVWCGSCAKCLFAYIILSPFIPPHRLNAIFGKAMLDDIGLRPLFEQLTGQAETKPFECVGTISEVHSALSMTIERWYSAQRPALLAGYTPCPPTTPLDRLSSHHNLNHDELALLDRYVQAAATI